jgi:hypothetical protein
VLIIINILAAWIAVSVVAGLAIAPAMSTRLREVNFYSQDK